MINRRYTVKLVVGLLLVYLTYISWVAYISDSYFLWTNLLSADTLASGEVRAGFFASSVVSLVFVLALWMLGHVKIYSLFDVLPAFILCVIWLLASSHPISGSYSQYPFRMFMGGGAMVFAFTGFGVMLGVIQWVKHRQKPVVDVNRMLMLILYTAVLYALDNLTRTAQAWYKVGYTGILLFLYIYQTQLIYPILVGCISALPFRNKATYNKSTGLVFLCLAGLCILINIFPYSIISNELNEFILRIETSLPLAGLRSALWPYMTGVLLVFGVYSFGSKARGSSLE